MGSTTDYRCTVKSNEVESEDWIDNRTTVVLLAGERRGVGSEDQTDNNTDDGSAVETTKVGTETGTRTCSDKK